MADLWLLFAPCFLPWFQWSGHAY